MPLPVFVRLASVARTYGVVPGFDASVCWFARRLREADNVMAPLPPTPSPLWGEGDFAGLRGAGAVGRFAGPQLRGASEFGGAGCSGA